MVEEHGYNEGLRDGRIKALEHVVSQHSRKFDSHESRLRIMERILYGLIGALALIEFLPKLQLFFGG